MIIHTLEAARAHIRKLLNELRTTKRCRSKAVEEADAWLDADQPDPWEDFSGDLQIEDWHDEVSNEDTRLGYLEWCAQQIENRRKDGEEWCTKCHLFFPAADKDLVPAERKEGDDPDGRCLECRGLEKCRECEEVYHTCGDGYDGLCPSCADRAEEAEDKIIYRTLEVRVGLRLPVGSEDEIDAAFNELDITVEPGDAGVRLVDQEVTAMRE